MPLESFRFLILSDKFSCEKNVVYQWNSPTSFLFLRNEWHRSENISGSEQDEVVTYRDNASPVRPDDPPPGHVTPHGERWRVSRIGGTCPQWLWARGRPVTPTHVSPCHTCRPGSWSPCMWWSPPCACPTVTQCSARGTPTPSGSTTTCSPTTTSWSDPCRTPQTLWLWG